MTRALVPPVYAIASTTAAAPSVVSLANPAALATLPEVGSLVSIFGSGTSLDCTNYTPWQVTAVTPTYSSGVLVGLTVALDNPTAPEAYAASPGSLNAPIASIAQAGGVVTVQLAAAPIPPAPPPWPQGFQTGMLATLAPPTITITPSKPTITVVSPTEISFEGSFVLAGGFVGVPLGTSTGTVGVLVNLTAAPVIVGITAGPAPVVTMLLPHGFSVGDTVLFYGTATGLDNGPSAPTYRIQAVPSPTTFVIDSSSGSTTPYAMPASTPPTAWLQDVPA